MANCDFGSPCNCRECEEMERARNDGKPCPNCGSVNTVSSGLYDAHSPKAPFKPRYKDYRKHYTSHITCNDCGKIFR